jgi:hypothetical protein
MADVERTLNEATSSFRRSSVGKATASKVRFMIDPRWSGPSCRVGDGARSTLWEMHSRHAGMQKMNWRAFDLNEPIVRDAFLIAIRRLRRWPVAPKGTRYSLDRR